MTRITFRDGPGKSALYGIGSRHILDRFGLGKSGRLDVRSEPGALLVFLAGASDNAATSRFLRECGNGFHGSECGDACLSVYSLVLLMPIRKAPGKRNPGAFYALRCYCGDLSYTGFGCASVGGNP